MFGYLMVRVSMRECGLNCANCWDDTKGFIEEALSSEIRCFECVDPKK
jgi:hypothetical protein